jgi:hypothetical protein
MADPIFDKIEQSFEEFVTDQVEGPTAMTPCNSSAIAAYGYVPALFTMTVIFHRGGKRIYFYNPVTPEEFNDFLNAESQGSFFNTNIKPGKNVI